MRHTCYTLDTFSLSTLPTLLLHNICNQKCATFATLWLHNHFPHFHSTFATLFLHNIGNQKCATLATLWIHFHFPHLLHFSYTTLVIKNAPHLLHFGYTTISHTWCPLFLHFSYTTLVIKNAPHLLHFATQPFPTLPFHICYTFPTQHW